MTDPIQLGASSPLNSSNAGMEALLMELQEREIRLEFCDGQLRYQAPAGALTPDIAAQIRNCKAGLLALFQEKIDSEGGVSEAARRHIARLSKDHGLNPKQVVIEHVEGSLVASMLRDAWRELLLKRSLWRRIPSGTVNVANDPSPELSGTGFEGPILRRNATLHDFEDSLEEPQIPFHEPPLIRCVVWQVGEASYLVGLCVHAIIADCIQAMKAMRELWEIYRALASDSNALPRLQPPMSKTFISARNHSLAPVTGGWQRGLEGYRNRLRESDRIPFKNCRTSFRLSRLQARRLKALAKKKRSSALLVLVAAIDYVREKNLPSPGLIGVVSESGPARNDTASGIPNNPRVLQTPEATNSFEHHIAHIAECWLTTIERADQEVAQFVEAQGLEPLACHQHLFDLLVVSMLGDDDPPVFLSSKYAFSGALTAEINGHGEEIGICLTGDGRTQGLTALFRISREVRALFSMPGDVDEACDVADSDLEVLREGGSHRNARDGDFENDVRGAWNRALGVSNVELDDNFFELGGHSMAAIRVGTEISRNLDINVPVHLVFAHPTLREFIAAVAELKPGQSGLALTLAFSEFITVTNEC